MNVIPENVAVAFRFAQGLWPHDPAAGSEATALTWSPALSGYTVDELCPVLEQLAQVSAKMPALSVVLEEVRKVRGKAQKPLAMITPRPLADVPPHPSADPWRAERRAEMIRYESHDGTRNGWGKRRISADRLAQINEEIAWVGPREAAKLAEHGIHVAVTMPSRAGGNAVVAQDEPASGPRQPRATAGSNDDSVAPLSEIGGAGPLPNDAADLPPASIDELAEQWLRDWRAASPEERSEMAAQNLSPELRAAIKERDVARKSAWA